MQRALCVRVLCGLILAATVAIPASAQVTFKSTPASFMPVEGSSGSKAEVAAGYHFNHGEGGDLPKGLFFAVNTTGGVGIAGRMEYIFADTGKIYAVLGGLRFGKSNGKAIPFGEALAGFASFLNGGGKAFAIEGGGGVDVMSGGKVGVRAAFHLKFIRDPSSGVWGQGWGLDIGVVFGAGSK